MFRPDSGEAYAFHTMVKPTGSQCNINCDYCFYLHKQTLLAQPAAPRMSEDVLAAHIRQYLEAQTVDEVVFTWQGGEPTLAGLDFYRRALALQQQYARPGQRVLNDIQTNGLLLDDEWCAFLKEHQFLVGLSVDGPPQLHDRLRRSNNGKPTYRYVARAIERLHRHGVPFNALCVVNRINADEPLAVYRFLRDTVQPRMIQFLAAVAPTDFEQQAPQHRGRRRYIPITQAVLHTGNPHRQQVTDWTVAPQQWGAFLVAVWQEWLVRDFGRVFIDQFENTLSQVLGYGAQKCTTAPICGKALAIEHNGDVYACDHFVYPQYKLGNILDVHQGHLAFSAKQEQFAYAKQTLLPRYCRRCEYLQWCWGECPKNRFVQTPDHEPGLNYLCAGLKLFYQCVAADLPQIRARLAASGRLPEAETSIGSALA